MFDNVYAPKAERNSFEPRATRTIYPLGSKSKRQRERELTRADAFTLIGLVTRSSEKRLNSAKNTMSQ